MRLAALEASTARNRNRSSGCPRIGLGERAEHVVGDLLVGQAQALGADAGVHLQRDRHEQVGEQDREDTEQGGTAGRLVGVLRSPR